MFEDILLMDHSSSILTSIIHHQYLRTMNFMINVLIGYFICKFESIHWPVALVSPNFQILLF